MLLAMAVVAARSGAPHDEMEGFTQRALDETAALPVTSDREKLRAFLFGVRANNRVWASELAGAREDAMAALELADDVSDRETVLEAELTLARIDIVDGRYETGLRDGMRAAREARDAGFESVGVSGYRNLAVMAARVMDHRSAQVAMAEGLQYADAIQQSHCRQMIATTTAFLDWGAGHWDAADERARHELVDRGCRRGTIGSLDVIGLIALGRGRANEARRWLDESLEAGRRIGEAHLILTPLWGLAEVDLLVGDADGAGARCEEALALATQTGERALLIPFVVTGARAHLAARRPDDAQRWLSRVRHHLAGWDTAAGQALSHADGLCSQAAGSLSAAREALERAIRGWDERGRIWEATWARLDLAGCLMRMNRHADAATMLAGVLATAGDLHSEPLLARAGELGRTGRGRGAEEEPWRPLTIREFEVARQVAAGLTNAQIARELFVSPKTISAHVEHILAKLGASRRAEIAAWAATIAAPDAEPVAIQA
jgi:DNA-binding CsgD family transcriptional regulator